MTVVADTQAPVVSVQLDALSVAVGDTVTIRVAASDDVAVQSVSLTVAGVAVPVDDQGLARVPMTVVGQFPVVATATDAAGHTSQATATLTVVDPNVTGVPSVALTSPSEGQSVTAPVEVIGTVADAHLLSYTLAVAALDTGVFSVIAQGTSNVSNGTLGQFDSTLLANGTYTLRLTALNAGGQVASVERSVEVDGHLKLGNFTLSFIDLTIPVAGLPITISRTYDTLNAARSGDFGYGWTLNYRDVRLQVSFPAGTFKGYGDYPAFQDGTRVYLTLPGRKREGFTFRPTPATFFGSVLYYVPTFVPDPGVFDQLQVPQVSLIKVGDDYVTMEESGLNDFNPADPTYGGVYTLVTPQRLTYTLDAAQGVLKSVSDRNGNTLTFSDSGIASDSGRQVVFQRDPRGRIIAVTDPLGQSIQYGYDGVGDLVSVTDRQGSRVELEYSATHPHYLDHMVDALGRTQVQVQYDATGRMVGLVDAAGNMVPLTTALGSLTQTLLDPLGHSTSTTYDRDGNVLQVVNAVGAVTRMTYDANDNLLAMTDPLGRTEIFTYDSFGDVSTQTDVRGNTIHLTYNSFGEILTSSDALGNTASNEYDSQGNRIAATDEYGNKTTYTLRNGLVTATTDPWGNVLARVTYDYFGNVINSTNAAGFTLTYVYDDLGNPTTSWYSYGSGSAETTEITQKNYDGDSHLVSVTQVHQNAQGQPQNLWIAHTEYSTTGQITQYTSPSGDSLATLYDSQGRSIQSTTPAADQNGVIRNKITRTVYDLIGRPIVVTDPYFEGDATIAGTRTVYDPAGRVIETQRLQGVEISIQGTAPHLDSVLTSAGTVLVSSQIVPDLDNGITQATDSAGNQTLTAYDRYGNLIEKRTQGVDAQGNTQWLVIRTVYDQAGRVIAQTDPYVESSAQPTTGSHVVYDLQGQIIRTDKLSGMVVDLQGSGQTLTSTLTFNGTVLSTMQSANDAAGRVSQTSDEFDTVVQHVYDISGRLIQTRAQTTDENGQTQWLIARTFYSTDGLTVTTTNPYLESSTGPVTGTQNVSDVRGEVISTANVTGLVIDITQLGVNNNSVLTNPGAVTSSTSTVYNGDGQVRQVTDQFGQTTSIEHDSVGRQTAVIYPATFDVASGQVVQRRVET